MSKEPGSDKKKSAWYVYILKASDGSLYTGVTTDVSRRFKEHGSPVRGARYFRGRKPQEVIYTECHTDRSSAQQREWIIKKLTREKKLELIGRVRKCPGAHID